MINMITYSVVIQYPKLLFQRSPKRETLVIQAYDLEFLHNELHLYSEQINSSFNVVSVSVLKSENKFFDYPSLPF